MSVQGIASSKACPQQPQHLKLLPRLGRHSGCAQTGDVWQHCPSPAGRVPRPHLGQRRCGVYRNIYIYYKLIHTLMVNAWDWTLVVFKLSGLGFSHPLGQSDKIMSTNSQNIVSASQRFRSVQTCHVGKQHRCAWCVVGCEMPRKHLHSQLAKKNADHHCPEPAAY